MKRLFVLILMASVSFAVSAQWFGKKQQKSSKEPSASAEMASQSDSVPGMQRLDEVFQMIFDNYVESPNTNSLSETAIRAMLKQLDPHSVYIPAQDVQRANESLQGNFDGIGITFQIVDDTICVGDVIEGGPSQKVGLLRGDKIIKVDSFAATGDSIKNSWVMNHLRGKKGTTVVLEVVRDGEHHTFHVVRDKIPIYSIDTHFMIDDTIGYIRLTRFARTSMSEFSKALKDLRKKGMKALLFDLRDNSGGYLDIACALANEFLKKGSLIVYTDGRAVKRQNTVANSRGGFREGRLVVLVNENSASASEIVSGAIQDHDRGFLVGRRTYGKGLVQRVFTLKDGGQVRLTTARYYTPSGRCIQKPYDGGTEKYLRDLAERYKSGEMVNPDSVHFPDSLKYKTDAGRIVYGGGGVMPDVFVPMDTIKLTPFMMKLRSKGLFNTWPAQWVNQHRNDAAVKDYETFLANYDSLNIDTLFAQYAESKEVIRDYEAEASLPAERVAHSDEYLHYLLKANVARNLFGTEYYYFVMRDLDREYHRAIRLLREGK
ncbi:MAG: S41 family peptidase [Bacteroidales bacterium]|nr:S41 family peptidase [Candidatus Colimorpha onthohippi]